MTRPADDVFSESFLEVRAKLLEVAATLDRIDRSVDAGSTLSSSLQSQRGKVDDAIRICLSEGPDRATRMQKLFSRDYDPQWRNEMSL